MAQIQKKFIAANAVDDTKIRLSNNTFLRARNAANSGDVSILKVDASDIIQFASVPEVAADPASSNALVRRSYVDNLLNGLKWKNSVRAATTADITLSGTQTIDTVVLIAGDRVLVKNQATASQNGIYVVAAGAWSRALDADSSAEIVSMAVFVEEGGVNADKGFVCTTNSPIVVDTTSLAFAQFTSAGSFSAGNGIDITGSTISVKLDTTPGLEFNTGSLRVQVDAAGAILRGASGLAISLEASNPSLQISTNELGLKIDAAGALQKTASGVSVKVDAATVKINGSDNLESLKQATDVITLTGTDITNQYVDLTHAAHSAGAISLTPVGGLEQQITADYTVSLTGGAGGVTRITFAGDLATGGAAALIAGDILLVKFLYL